MNLLIVSVLTSFLGAVFMLVRKMHEVAPHTEIVGEEAHTNFITDFFCQLKCKALETSQDIYLHLRPHAHDFASRAASRIYKLSAWFADESLKIHNFIQGRKILRNSGNTSLFIKDIIRDREESRANRK